METMPHLPETVLHDLQLYLSEGETIRKAISSASGLVGRLGELWMVLTDRTVYFHTREFGKEAVVALLLRRDIDSILYFQSRRGYTLTFTPRSAPQNITRVSFPREQRDRLENFCEELADIIEFQAEGHPPIKPGEPLITPSADARPPVPPVPPITTVSTVPAVGSARTGENEREATERPPSSPAPAGIDTAGQIPSPASVSGVRLARPMGLPEPRRAGPKTGQPGPTLSPPGEATGAGNQLSALGLDTAGVETAPLPAVRLAGGEGPGLKYAVVATAVSFAVGFLWYRLFRALEDTR